MTGTTNDDLADAAVRRRLHLLRYEAGATRDVVGAYNDLVGDLFKELQQLEKKARRGIPLSVADRVRVRELAGSMQDVLKMANADITAILTDRLSEAVEVEARAAASSIRVALPASVENTGLLVAEVPLADALVAVTEPIGGHIWTDRLAVDLMEQNDLLQSTVARAVAEGQSIPNAARALKQGTTIVETYRGRFRAIARTEIQRVANTAAQDTYRANKDVIKGVQYLATLDSRTCIICAPFHNQEFSLTPSGNIPGDAPIIPQHPNCFPAGTMVKASQVLASTDRVYSGDVVEIETLKGRVLTGTPNHPILTTTGWVAIGELRTGSVVIVREESDDAVSIEIVKAGADAEASTAVSVSADDFHGDGSGSGPCTVRPHAAISNHPDAHPFAPGSNLPHDVRTDAVARVGRRPFSGRVYNLQTSTGWYEASGIIVHNCRCFYAPIAKSFRELGIDIDDKAEQRRLDGNLAENMTFDAWLKRQPHDVQADVLGPTKAKAWRSGAIKLDQFTDQGRPLALGELRSLYPGAIPG